MKLPNLRNLVIRTDGLPKKVEKVAIVTWIIGKK